MKTTQNEISIWFFIGISLLVNGVLITGAGLYELVRPPEIKVVLYHLHASLWWGIVLLIVGAVYCVKFSPCRQANAECTTEVTEEVHVG